MVLFCFVFNNNYLDAVETFPRIATAVWEKTENKENIISKLKANFSCLLSPLSLPNKECASPSKEDIDFFKK